MRSKINSWLVSSDCPVVFDYYALASLSGLEIGDKAWSNIYRHFSELAEAGKVRNSEGWFSVVESARPYSNAVG